MMRKDKRFSKVVMFKLNQYLKKDDLLNLMLVCKDFHKKLSCELIIWKRFQYFKVLPQDFKIIKRIVCEKLKSCNLNKRYKSYISETVQLLSKKNNIEINEHFMKLMIDEFESLGHNVDSYIDYISKFKKSRYPYSAHRDFYKVCEITSKYNFGALTQEEKSVFPDILRSFIIAIIKIN